MTHIFIIAAAVSALLAIAADWNEQRHASFYLLKPLKTALIFGIAGQAGPGQLCTLVLGRKG